VTAAVDQIEAQLGLPNVVIHNAAGNWLILNFIWFEIGLLFLLTLPMFQRFLSGSGINRVWIQEGKKNPHQKKN
jgi:hypothetical protein